LEDGCRFCKTKKQQVAEFYAKKRGWWSYKADDYQTPHKRGDCYEFADEIINIIDEVEKN
jgi:hypothetical protein